MRYLLIGLVMLCMSSPILRAQDDSEKLVYLGSCFESKNGTLQISLSHHWLIWKNGVRQYFYVGEGHEVALKPGDVLVTGDGNRNPYASKDEYGFYRYQLDRLTPEKAFLTVWQAPVIREQLSAKSFNVRPGEFVWKEQIAVTLPVVIEDDSYVNGLELKTGKSPRTK